MFFFFSFALSLQMLGISHFSSASFRLFLFSVSVETFSIMYLSLRRDTWRDMEMGPNDGFSWKTGLDDSRIKCIKCPLFDLALLWMLNDDCAEGVDPGYMLGWNVTSNFYLLRGSFGIEQKRGSRWLWERWWEVWLGWWHDSWMVGEGECNRHSRRSKTFS